MTRPSRKMNGKVEILIAEDSPTQAAQLAHLLEEHGYAVTTASNGREALALLERFTPTLIITDVLMPELDGYGLCKAVKATEKWKHILVMLVTTLSDALDVVRGLECGADNFIRKPYDEKYLLSRVDYLLMNLELRKNQKMQIGVEISLGGQRHFVSSERQQILDLLISTYEQAVQINEELKLREKELAHSNQVLAGLYRIAEGLNHAGSEREVVERAVERALELPGIQAGWISLREGESGFRLAAARNLPPALEVTGAMEGDCACRRRLLSGELDSVTNILECERLQKAAGDKGGLLYHASVPLWLGDRTLGVMNLLGPEKGLFNEDELKVLYSVGNQLAVALERARLREHLEKLVEERTARIIRLNRIYAVLSGINTIIVRVRERQQLFEEACRIAVEQGKFTFAWIGMLDAGTKEVVPVAKAGRDDGYLSQINLTALEDAPGSCELTTHALTRGAPVVCNDIASDDRMKTWRVEALDRGYRSVALFPLFLESQPIGVFALYAPEPGVFDEEEMALLVEMAGDISFALDNLRKEELLEQRTAALTAEIAERVQIEQHQARLVRIIDATPDFMAISDANQNVVYCNQAGLRMLGYAPGHDLSTMNIAETHPEWAAKLVLETGIPHAIEHGSWAGETAFLRTDGREVPTSQVILAHRGADGSVEYLSTIARDMTARNDAENELRLQARRQSAVAELGRIAMTSADSQFVFDAACPLVAETLDAPFATIFEALPGGDEVVARAATGWSFEIAGMRFPAQQGSQAGYTLMCGSPVVVADYPTETRFRPPRLLFEQGIVSGVSTVIPGREGPFGVIASLTTKPRSFSDNDVLFICAIANILGEVVERRLMEQALRRSEERYRQIVEGAQEGICTADANNRIIFANSRAGDMLGYTAEETIGRSLFDFIDPAATADVESRIARRRSGLSDDYDLLFRRRDGTPVWTRITASPLTDASGNYAGSLAMITDTSERHEAEERLRASEEKFRALVENSLDGILLLDRDGRILYASPAVTRILGYEVDDVVGLDSFTLVHSDDVAYAHERFAAALTVGAEPMSAEFRIRHKDGTWRYLECLRGNRLDDPSVRAIVLNYRDVTESRQSRDALDQLRRRYEMILSCAAEGILGLDVEGRIVFANTAAETMFGWSAEEFANIDTHRQIHHTKPDGTPYPSAECPMNLMMRDGETRSVTNEFFWRRNGERFAVEYTCAPIYDGTTIIGGVVTVKDVSEQNLLRRQLDQAQRIDSLGRVAATIAHEFNNVLMGIQPFAEVIRRRAGDDERISKAAEQISNSVRRGKRVTEEILRFARPGEPALEVMDMAKWVAAIEPELRSVAGSSVQLNLVRSPASIFARCDSAQMQQVVTNLVINARDAMPGGGTITLTLATSTRDDNLFIGQSEHERFVQLTVRDVGSGIAPEMLEQIFEPLFTTKRSGTGLGLAVARQVVTLHGGFIFAENAPGGGTAFHIFLPRVDEALSTAAAVAAQKTNGRIRRLLLVEDEVSVAAGLSSLLELEEIAVRVVGLGREVVPAIEEFAPDAVILDLTLPDIDGREVFAQIAARWPDLPVVFSTGHGSEAELAHELARDHVGFLRKPYDVDALMAAIERVL